MTWPVAENMPWSLLLSLITAFMPTKSEELRPNLQPRQSPRSKWMQASTRLRTTDLLKHHLTQPRAKKFLRQRRGQSQSI